MDDALVGVARRALDLFVEELDELRQGEPVDVVAAGIPLTRTEHVYTAKPVPPSQAVPR